MLPPTFGETLKQLREWADFTQEELAARLDVNARTLRKWERPPRNRRQQRPISRYDALRLLRIFDDWLTPSEAKGWMGQAGYRLTRKELADLFPAHAVSPSFQIPMLTGFYQPRPAEEKAIAAHLKSSSLVLWGSGGAGKSTLAARVAEQLHADFPDGVIWVAVGEGADVSALQEQIADAASVFLSGREEAARAGELRAALRQKRCLLVLDDVWEGQSLPHLLVTGGDSRALITTRDAKIADLHALPRLKIGGLQAEEALGLLRQWSGSSEFPSMAALAQRVGFLPLALSLVGARLREGDSPADLLAALHQEQLALGALDMDAPQSRSESLSLCFDLSYTPLDDETQKRFAALGVFENRFAVETVAAVLGLDADEARQSLRHLHRLALLKRFGQQYQLHSLLRDYARQKLRQFPQQEQSIRSRHARYFIRHHLYHPGLLDEKAAAPPLTQAWGDVVAGVRWAAVHAPRLAAQAALLAHSERQALLEAVGSPLLNAAARLAATSNASPLWMDLSGDLYLLRGDFPAAADAFSTAENLWATQNEFLAAATSTLRLAGAHLLQGSFPRAAETARHAQTHLQTALPLPDDAALARFFYWLVNLYAPLTRWQDLPADDPKRWVWLARQCASPNALARANSIRRLWFTAPNTHRLQREADCRQTAALALEAFRLWRSAGRQDLADSEVTWTTFYLKGRLSRRAARRYAKRRIATSPKLPPEMAETIADPDLRWWFSAPEAERVAWMAEMLPRYEKASNVSNPLADNSPERRRMERILQAGTLGRGGRVPAFPGKAPAGHILNHTEWVILGGYRAFPLVIPAARETAQKALAEIAV